MNVRVAYASKTQQFEVSLEFPPATVVRHAIERSGVLKYFPEINLSVNRVGIFGELKTLDTVLQEGDRVEVYRPLTIDPKEARRLRAQRK